MNKLTRSRWFPHAAAVIVSLLVILFYFNPMLSGKVLKQHDVKQWQATYHETEEFQTTTGERTFWTNSIFSGMPNFLIGPGYKYNFTTDISAFISKVLPNPTDTLFLLFICFYIMLLAFDVNPWWAVMGGLAFMMSSFNFINIDAGHVGKGNAIAYMPLVIAGIRITLRKHRLLGALLTGIALSFQLTAGHVQITYYLMFIIIAWMIAEMIMAIRNKTFAHLAICGVFLVVAAGIGVATNATSLMATEEYGKYSIRGKSELTKTTTGEGKEEIASSGLDKDYALQWSNGVSEPMTLLIPDFYGGASGGELSVNSDTYKTLVDNGVPKNSAKQFVQSLPLYWGDQPMTAGPIYYGAIICFLFVFGLFVVKGAEKWWILGVSVVAILLSMGRNFMPFTDLFFYNIPMYNKFRSVTFILCITQTTFPLLALLGLRDAIEGKLKTPDLKKSLLYSLYITGGLCVIFLIPGIFFDYTSSYTDDNFKRNLLNMGVQENMASDIITSLASDRAGLQQADALRSLVFVLLAFGTLWFWLSGRLKKPVVIAALTFLIVFDLWQVDKRYLNNDDFEVKKKNAAQSFTKSQADEFILQDKDPNFRVYNTTQRLDQDALTSYWHKSIGGYHGAKMRRYQELIEFQLAKGNPETFNMLNVKYFIVADSTNNLYPQQNPRANGNAWFVSRFYIVPDADAEMDSLSGLATRSAAVIDQRFADQVAGLNITTDSSDYIKLTSYAPNKLVYESSASSDQFAVFSEIYYEKGWNAYVDGQPVPHFRCDYVLRGMKVPAGKHSIEFRFEPEVVAKGEAISLAASITLYAGILVIGGLVYFRRRKETGDDKKA